MAEDLYEQYVGLLDQQVDLAEKTVIGIVRAAFGDFSSDFKRHLRSLVPPRRRPPDTSGAPSSNQQLTRAQEVIETARDSAQRQIATALANGFGALADLPSALGFSANQPSISGLSTQANVSAIAVNNNDDNSDDDSMSIKSEDTSECESDFESHSDDTEIKEEAIDEMAATAGTSNVNSNNDNVFVKTEIESECDSSDTESSDDEEELTAGREIKEEIVDANPNNQIMGNSLDENAGMQMMEQEENETQSINKTNTKDSNFEMTDAMMIESDDEPAIIGNYDEFEAQSIGGPNNQGTVAEGSLNNESMSITEPDGEFDVNAGTTNSNEDAERDQAGPPIVSNPTSTLTDRSIQASRTVNYSEGMENSLSGQQGNLQTGTRKSKRKTGRSGKSNASKRSRVDPAPTVTADETDDEDAPESGAIKLSVIARRLNCSVPGCNEVFSGKVQLDGHLLVKHAIERYACIVKDCTESYATSDQLTSHRNTAHDNLDNVWPCGQCDVTCNTYKDLYTHMNKYHEYGLFACSADKCNFTEKTRVKVYTHQLKHQPAKHRCTYPSCSSSFNQKSRLTAHLRVHSKEKPFLCSQCPKAYAHKSHLTEHERIHSGFKPFSCTWAPCDFSASRKSSVIAHIRVVHFGLPKSKKKQAEMRIIDNRDARVFVKTSTTGN